MLASPEVPRRLQEGIRTFLPPDGRRGTVPRKDLHIVPQREELCANPGKEQVLVASGQVPASHTAGKQHVPAKDQPLGTGKKAEASRAMPGHFEHLEFHASELAGGRFGDHQLRHERLDIEREPEPAEEIRLGDHRDRVRMAADLAAVLAADAGGVPDVIDMAVGEQEEADVVSLPGQPAGGVLRGVDQDAALREVKAVRVEHPAGKAVYDHRAE